MKPFKRALHPPVVPATGGEGRRIRLSGKAIVLVLAIVALLATVVTLLIVFFGTERQDASAVQYAVLVNEADNTVSIYRSDRLLGTLDGVPVSEKNSFGGRAKAVLTDDGVLALVYEKEVYVLSEDAVDFRLSQRGTSVVYLEKDGSLSVRESGSKESVRVEEDYPAPNLNGLSISPSSTVLCYPDADGEALIVWKKGQISTLTPPESEGGLRILGISDRADHIYFLTDFDSTLYHTALDATPTKLTASFSAAPSGVRFNYDLSQILFCEGNGCTYFSEGGREKEKVAGGVAVPLLYLREAEYAMDAVGLCSALSCEDFRARLYLVRNEDVQELRFMNEDWSSEGYVSDVHSAHVSSDRKDLYYARPGEGTYRLYHLDLRSEKRTETLIASGVTDYTFSPDGEDLYYITYGEKLYRRVDGVDTLLSDEAEGIFVSPRGKVYWTVLVEQGQVVYELRENEGYALSNDVWKLSFTQKDVYAFIGDEEASASWHVLKGDSFEPLA